MIYLVQADARRIPLRDESVQCVVTSPPYFHVRDYGLAPTVWGGLSACDHNWAAGGLSKTGCNHGSKDGFTRRAPRLGRTRHDTCAECGAWRGQLGLEPTVQMYVAHLVEVFREVRRVLRRDGTLWLNIGDSYASSSLSNHNRGLATPAFNGRGERRTGAFAWENPPRTPPSPGTKAKDLLLVPWRLALALQDDGWWVRCDVVWNKPNGMPEAVTDRPARLHEYVLLLSRSSKYFYSAESVREPIQSDRRAKSTGVGHAELRAGTRYDGTGTHRHARAVWTIPTEPYDGAHFAPMPEALVDRCLRASTRPGAVVLDPFSGSGTVGRVAARLGRSAVLVDLNPEYQSLAKDRTTEVQVDLLAANGVDA